MTHGGQRIVERLHAEFRERAARRMVDRLILGLGFTAVVLDDGAAGLAYTWTDGGECCSHVKGWDGAEGAPSLGLLDLLLGETGLERSVGMAAANALNHADALASPRDEGPAGSLVRELGVRRGTRVSMVGFFPPVARALEEEGADLDIVDDARRMGNPVEFREHLADWTELLVMTSTTLLGDTADDLLLSAGPEVRVVFLGPTTPLVPQAFAGTRVRLLGGMTPVDIDGVLRSVRHGGGAPELQRYCRKVYRLCPVAEDRPG